MRARVIRIGNSQGLRIPKTLLDQCGIEDVVELTVEEGRIAISPVSSPRAGWAEAARQMAARGEDGLVDEATPTAFDDSEWQWPD
jgi:antitoxin MazE